MIKTIVWAATVLGLTPVALLAVAQIISTIALARLPKLPDEPGTTSLVGDVTVQMGSSGKLHLSTHIWPAVTVTIGVLAVLVGLFFFIPRQPDRIRTRGFSKVESYLSRLLRSRAEHASMIMATPDGMHALLVTQRPGEPPTLHVSADRTKGPEEELRTREFFSKLGMTPAHEHISGNGDIPDASLDFEYSLVGDAHQISGLCVSVFQNLFRVTDETGLQFRTTGL